MKYIFLFALISLQFTVGKTQSLKLPVGKKFKVITSTSNLAEVTVMDNHMQMQSDGSIQMAFELTAVTHTGYTLQVTPVNMKSTMSMNGMEQKIDTDDSSAMANPMFAPLKNLMNQPQSIEVENNKVIKNSQLAMLNQTGMQDDNSKLFLTVDNSQMHIGFQWTDSTNSETSKMVNQYIVMQLTDSTVTLHVKSDFSIHNNVEQAGMKMEQNLKGISNGERTYTRLNGLLKEESIDIDISGSTETQQMSSPVTMKMKIKSIVN
ncbi:MAG: DUF6263 family protein [Bacteroidota bacterium]